MKSGKDIHQRIKMRREELGISQSELARMIGVKPQTVQQWEAGTTAPKRKRLLDVANALDTTITYLLAGTDHSDYSEQTLTRWGLVAEENENYIPVKTIIMRLSGEESPVGDIAKILHYAFDGKIRKIDSELLLQIAKRLIIEGGKNE